MICKRAGGVSRDQCLSPGTVHGQSMTRRAAPTRIMTAAQMASQSIAAKTRTSVSVRRLWSLILSYTRSNRSWLISMAADFFGTSCR